MLFPTNANQVQAFAGALYGVQVGSVTMAQVTSDISSGGGLNAVLNRYYSASFGSMTTTAVATSFATNLGLTGEALTEGVAYTVARLNAVSADARGAEISDILNLFSTLTADATFGTAATAWTTKVGTAAAYTGTTNVAIGTVVAASNVFTLTTSVDNFTGSSADDTFNADNTGATATTSSADMLNGGDGTDTLNIYSAGAAGALPNLTSIEIVNVYDQDAALDVSSTAFSSVTALNLIRGDGGITTVGANVASISLTDFVVPSVQGNDDIVLNFGAARTAATLNLSGISSAAGAADENIEVNGAALTSLTVNVLTASEFDNLDAAGATSIAINATGNLTTVLATTGTAALTITGAGNVNLGALDADINTVTSTGTGALTAAIGANVDTVLTAGSGNDVITASTTDTIASTDALAVDGGAGIDTLIIAQTVDIDTAADAARYTNFETVRLSESYVASLISGITAIELLASDSMTFTALTATQAGNVKLLGDVTSPTFALQTATGTADVLTLTMGTGLKTAPASDIVTGMTVTGFETLNIVENGGPTASAGAAQTAIVAAFTGATLNDINLSGRAVTLSNIATTVAVDINGSALTGNGATGTAVQGLTANGSAVVGSVITGSAFRDAFTIGAEGSAYNGGAGNDTFTTTEAILLADGTTDGTFVGGEGTDTMVVSTTAATLNDNHFIKMSGFEALTTSTGSTSITTGGAFNAAFTSGVTVTTGTLANTSTYLWAGGLYSGNTTITIDGTALTMATAANVTVTTGAGNDTITFTGDDTTTGNTANTDGGSLIISTGAGADTIFVTYGTLDDQTTSQFATITAGTGADLITKVGTNGTTVASTTTFVMAAGDSGTTFATMDRITGFDLGVTTGTLKADTLEFEGTAAVSAFSATVDFGVIKSHTFATAGIITFDDIDTFASALVINPSNLADVVGYLNTNLATNGTVAFAFDSDSNGVADGTMVYHQGSSLTTVADDMVFLVGVTGGSLVVQGGTTEANGVIGIL